MVTINAWAAANRLDRRSVLCPISRYEKTVVSSQQT